MLADTGTKALPTASFEAMDDALMGRGNTKLLHMHELNRDTQMMTATHAPGPRRSTKADEFTSAEEAGGGKISRTIEERGKAVNEN